MSVRCASGRSTIDSPDAGAPRRRAPWRDNIEAVVMAVAMALFLKHFVVEAYKIPTGSMQPTLIGDEAADVKDRILVDKVGYAFTDPERWDVAVFRYPLDRSKNFVKRIAGIGPEELKIEHGDVWVRGPGEEWHVPRRPRGVMETLWKRLDAEGGAPQLSRWIPRDLPHSSQWRAEGRAIEARGRGTAAFRGGREPIVDDYFDGYPEALVEWLPAHPADSGQNRVGDLRLEGEITALPGLESFTVVLLEGPRRYRFELAGPAARAGSVTRIDAGPSARGAAAEDGADRRLPIGRPVRFAVENLDDRLALELDGREVLAREIEPAADQTSAILLELEGEGADLAELMPYRDVHYTGGGPPIAIPAEHYFMLGDNTQDSSDSREWTLVTYRLRDAGPDAPPPPAEDGEALELPEGRILRGNWRNGENPRTVYGPDGPVTTLVDEWGERHWFRPDEARRGAPSAAPFVPRAMIQGRALAVFWPLDPARDIWRLKWVN